MNKAIVVNEYSNKYQSQIVDLILNIQQIEYNVSITIADQPDLLKIENFYQYKNGNFWLALDGEKVVGTVALLDIGNHQVALRKMFVDKEYRGRTFNTASLLLNKAIEWSKEKDTCEIYLGTTLQFVAAHRFYEKNGFQEILVKDLPPSFPILKVDKKFYKYVV